MAGVRQHHQAAIEHQSIGAEANGIGQVAAQFQLPAPASAKAITAPTAGRQIACQRWLPTAGAGLQGKGLAIPFGGHPTPVEPHPQAAQATVQFQAPLHSIGAGNRQGRQDPQQRHHHKAFHPAEAIGSIPSRPVRAATPSMATAANQAAPSVVLVEPMCCPMLKQSSLIMAGSTCLIDSQKSLIFSKPTLISCWH